MHHGNMGFMEYNDQQNELLALTAVDLEQRTMDRGPASPQRPETMSYHPCCDHRYSSVLTVDRQLVQFQHHLRIMPLIGNL